MMETELPPGSCNSTGHLSTIGWNIPGRMHHSASTPAGVDGGARTPPATPKKGGKMLAVRVQMLDDSISMFQIQSKALGRVLFDQVCRQLHLLEADYFGLEYQDANGTKYWLDVEKPMCRQVGLSMLEPTLRFCVKFYTPDPARLEEEFTRYLFCLQVKRDLAQGCIQCNENTAALIASYIVQAECGDFVPEDYPDHTYLSGYKFFPGQDLESERRIMENHKKHIGQSPAEADLNLLETARRCELYGVKMHAAKDHEGVPLNLAVAHMGIVVFQHFTKINTFSWAKIRKISFKRKRFLIKLHSEGYAHFRDVVEFFFEGRNECKNFWKKCVENHGFFRCTSVPRLPRHKTRVMSRGSSFRYSGKTQKQIVEFVRDNYVKRQTFQRSGSFRASRSAGSSRGNVSAPALNASVSAHPLLPLPPGSDAISLEWDKQPHYLEASLMMKGYSAEEARAAARRASARPPPPATAYASTRDKLTKLYCNQIAGPEVVTHAEVNHHPTEDSPLPPQTTTPLTSPCWIVAEDSGRARAPTPPPRASRPRTPEETSPEDEHTVSSASLCMSPNGDTSTGAPLYASTPHEKRIPNGYHERIERLDNRRELVDTLNGNVHVNIVSASTNNMDVLSGGESDAGDTLTRRNNNSISSGAVLSGDATKRRGADVTYYVAKELLMTERTYKRDLELITVTWSKRVGSIGRSASSGAEAAALARACLALEPLALPAGALLAKLDRALAATSPSTNLPGDTEEPDLESLLSMPAGPLLAYLDSVLSSIESTINSNDIQEPEYKKVAELLNDYLSNTFDAYNEYIQQVGAMVALVESARRRGGDGARQAAAFDRAAPLPLACLLLRPLHRLHHYRRLSHELWSATGSKAARKAHELAHELAETADDQLRHVENHATLCQLQRDIIGYDKLLVVDREFVRYGCVYKHSSKGLQQRMLILFSDMLLLTSKCVSGHFRAHNVLALQQLSVEPTDLPHSFVITGEDTNITLSTSNEQEYQGWLQSLSASIEAARDRPNKVDTQLTPQLQDYDDPESSEAPSGAGGSSAGSALAHVCWHRATSLRRDQLHLAMRSQLSGYLLRKFKNSHGWQKLWVVFAVFTLFFYKTCRDRAPLASLPLLGYSVGAPSPGDGIDKEFVFKLQFKNHVYFFRADSHFTYNRWIEVLQTPMLSHQN
ncbi:FERM, ARHGEF and pleckstrin domain-containing protein 1 isoform X1 [Pararge aegeria]|uniref:FERM, ARHGEF and pleckstrin domain-containing protein 1 isoform X1 n=1 Tax=Pararge aegeria TaxID=116150 RepID=UPI0019D1C181|nr:FERM, ARHGEF and pleckstrin domain-containing protein 1 isoform X1 [Pararge aegeria]